MKTQVYCIEGGRPLPFAQAEGIIPSPNPRLDTERWIRFIRYTQDDNGVTVGKELAVFKAVIKSGDGEVQCEIRMEWRKVRGQLLTDTAPLNRYIIWEDEEESHDDDLQSGIC